MKQGPGEYVPDSSEGITSPDDLPVPILVTRSRDYAHRPCPHCGHSCYRHSVAQRTLHDLGCPLSGRPRILEVSYSKHFCSVCKRYFSVAMPDLAAPGSHYTNRVIALATRLVVEDDMPFRVASWHLWRDHRVFVPWATIQNWSEASGKKKPDPCRGAVPRCSGCRFLRLSGCR